MKYSVASLTLSVLLIGLPAHAQKRALAVDDIYSLKEVRDPQRSPDGRWVAYVVSHAIKDTDKNDTDIWMASWDGSQDLQLTSSPDGESRPRWSPDNKYLSFVSSRQGAKHGQLWLMNRAGGEAIKVTDLKAGIADYEWAPDGKRLVLVVNEPDPRDPKRTTRPRGRRRRRRRRS
jgi:dipeptidyl aminopeptidase/acylaminoacyl peptidase